MLPAVSISQALSLRRRRALLPAIAAAIAASYAVLLGVLYGSQHARAHPQPASAAWSRAPVATISPSFATSSPTPAPQELGRARRLTHREAAAAIASIDGPGAEFGEAEADGALSEAMRLLVWPTAETRLNSSFGYRTNPLTGDSSQLHRGVDVRAACGNQVLAAARGVVVFAEWTASSGNTIKVAHGTDLVTRYAHLSTLAVNVGDRVSAGEVIGLTGATGAMSTGPHLHFEVWHAGVPTDPMAFRYRHLSAATRAPGEASCGAGVESGGAALASLGGTSPHDGASAYELYASIVGN